MLLASFAMHGFVQDLRFALRQFRSRPGFSAATILILGFGLGANTAIFSLVNALLLRPLPFHDAGRILALYERNIAGNGSVYNSVAPGTFADWRKLSNSFGEMAAYTAGPLTVGGPQGLAPERVDAVAVSREFFTILGIPPLRGRTFTAEEDRFGAARVAVISYGLWQQRFGGAVDMVGRRIRLDGVESAVIGIMPRGFAFPERTTEVWLALDSILAPPRYERHDSHFLRVIARLKPGVTPEQARAEIDGISARYRQGHPDDAVAPGANALALPQALVRQSRSTVLLLWAAVGCVLLIACVNVANLLLARGSGRAREIAVRAATGASRWRIVRLLLTESLALSVAGAVLGIVIAMFAADLVAARAPGGATMLYSEGIPFDWRVFLFAFAAGLAVGVASGLFPALQCSRGDLAQGLREGGRSATHGRSHSRFRATLAAVEVAISLVLLVAAGLLLRSFTHVMDVNPGVRVERTITMMVPFIERPPARALALMRDLPRRLEAIPGVVSAGLTSCLPATGHCNDNFFYIDGRPTQSGTMTDALQRNADPGYFGAIGLPLLRGRTFVEEDGIGPDRAHPRRPVVIISESLAKTFFPSQDPIGQRIWLNADMQQKTRGLPVPHYEIVGVVGDAPSEVDRTAAPTFYMPLTDQTNYDQIYVVLHTAGDPRSAIAAARREINRLDPDLAIDQIRTIRELLAQSAASYEWNVALFGCFAGLALLLAAFGLYSVLSYAVSQRRAEIGVRMALGASGAGVAGIILREGMRPVLAGMLLGLAGAAACCGLLKALLYGVEPLDPVTFAIASATLVGVAAVACYLPALRAVRIDPALTLRSDWSGPIQSH